MGRFLKLAVPSAALLGLQGCLPNDFFPTLLGSSIAELSGILLSDLLNTFFPAI
jgi:hypothetical protein